MSTYRMISVFSRLTKQKHTYATCYVKHVSCFCSCLKEGRRKDHKRQHRCDWTNLNCLSVLCGHRLPQSHAIHQREEQCRRGENWWVAAGNVTGQWWCPLRGLIPRWIWGGGQELRRMPRDSTATSANWASRWTSTATWAVRKSTSCFRQVTHTQCVTQVTQCLHFVCCLHLLHVRLWTLVLVHIQRNLGQFKEPEENITFRRCTDVKTQGFYLEPLQVLPRTFPIMNWHFKEQIPQNICRSISVTISGILHSHWTEMKVTWKIKCWDILTKGLLIELLSVPRIFFYN